MIDFRYHLVSIASVFLALAVGIVLGAGPLRGTLGDTLASEVAQLREDAGSLRSELAAAESGVSARDDVITTLGPRSTDSLLTGSTVSVLALPGSSDTAVEAARESITVAGGSLGAAVRVADAWTSQEPPDITDRTSAATELRGLLAGDLPVGIAPERVIDLALGWALATDPTVGSIDDDPEAGAEGQPTETAPSSPTDSPDAASENDGLSGGTARPRGDGSSGRILEILATYGLLTIDGGEAPARADGVVIITPATGDDASAPVTEWADIAGAIDEAGAVVVAGDLSDESDADTDLVEAVRDGTALRDRVSTLDNLTSPVGRVALPFVLAEQLTGQAGHYGALGSTDQLFPPMPVDGAP